jgi:polar amino acid transport system substrate-binding protein
MLALAACIIAGCQRQSSAPNDPKAQNAYERVVETGKLRLGYVPYPPGLIKDPNTKKITGIFAEVIEEAAGNLDLKVEWIEEVGWGTMVEGLKANRYDMIGSPVWPLSQRAKLADFTVPIYYGGLAAYVRADDRRFDGNLALLNDPSVKIATIDGEVTDNVAKYDFPKAQSVSNPQGTEIASLLKTVTSGRADVTFVEPFVALEFLKNNPNTLREPVPGQTIRLYPNTYMFYRDQGHFKPMLDNAIMELVNNGFVDRVLDKYEPAKGAFYRRALPYRTSNK